MVHKFFEVALNAIQCLVLHKIFGPTQNILGLAEGPSIRIIPHLCRSAFMTWCFQKKRGRAVVNFARLLHLHLVLGATPCSLLAAKSPSNKVLRRAFSIVWMTSSQNLCCVHWTNKNGPSQDLYEMS